jgi:multisubunit Na+/H+ antiporter MnhB subunit
MPPGDQGSAVIVLGAAVALLALAASIQAARRWRQGDRAPVLVFALVVALLVLFFGAVFLLYALHDSASPN